MAIEKKEGTNKTKKCETYSKSMEGKVSEMQFFCKSAKT